MNPLVIYVSIGTIYCIMTMPIDRTVAILLAIFAWPVVIPAMIFTWWKGL